MISASEEEELHSLIDSLRDRDLLECSFYRFTHVPTSHGLCALLTFRETRFHDSDLSDSGESDVKLWLRW